MRLEPIAENLRIQLMSRLAQEPAEDPTLWEWVDKCRRFSSLYGHRLTSVSRERFGHQEAIEQLLWLVEFLLTAARTYPKRGELPLDPLLLSAALFASDALGSNNKDGLLREIEKGLLALRRYHGNSPTRPKLTALGPVFDPSRVEWQNESGRAPSVIILFPNPFSIFSLTLLEIFLRLDVEIRGIVVRTFTADRVLSEFHRDRKVFLRKIWRRFFLRHNRRFDATAISGDGLLKGLKCQHLNASRIAGAHGIDALSVRDFSEPGLTSWLNEKSADVGSFGGGGILRPQIIEAFRLGVLNIHMGHLPFYRGTNVRQWSLLDARFENIGATAHMMDEGVDSGPVLQRIDIEARACQSLQELRNFFEGWMPLLHVDTVLGLGSGRIVSQRQWSKYRVCYSAHPRLVEIIENVIFQRSDFGDLEQSALGVRDFENLIAYIGSMVSPPRRD
jgi:hypothetical protein